MTDAAATGTLAGYNYGTNAAIFASPLTSLPSSCSNAVNSPCLNTSQFAPSAAATGFPTGFGNGGRNSIYGPHFFDVDIALSKSVALGEHVTFTFGAQAYNAFNHKFRSAGCGYFQPAIRFEHSCRRSSDQLAGLVRRRGKFPEVRRDPRCAEILNGSWYTSHSVPGSE